MTKTKEIPLTQNKIAIVDTADYDWLSQWKWCAWKVKSRHTYYAIRTQRINGKNTTVRMHRLILDAEDGTPIDHKDGNGLNNTRDNLRVANPLQNAQNSRTPTNNTSGYKGVYWHKATGKWMVRINVDNKRKHLGLFTSLEEAARAYDVAALELHGAFARTNFTHTQQEIKAMNTYRTGYTDLTLDDMQAAWFANTVNDSHREAPDSFPTIDRAITEHVGLQFDTAAEARTEYERGAKVLEQFAVFMSSRTTIPFIDGKPTESRTENAAAWYVTDSGHIATTPAYRFIYFYQRKDVAQAA